MAYMLEWVTKMAQSYTSTIWEPIYLRKRSESKASPSRLKTEEEWERLVRDLFLFALFKGLSGRILVVSGGIYFGKKGPSSSPNFWEEEG